MSLGKRFPHLVAYDIRDPDRGRQVLRLLKEEGVPLQYSLFLCLLDARSREWLAHRLERIIDTRCDDVRIYPLPERPWQRRWGRGAVSLEYALLGLDDGGLLDGWHSKEEEEERP